MESVPGTAACPPVELDSASWLLVSSPLSWPSGCEKSCVVLSVLSKLMSRFNPTCTSEYIPESTSISFTRFSTASDAFCCVLKLFVAIMESDSMSAPENKIFAFFWLISVMFFRESLPSAVATNLAMAYACSSSISPVNASETLAELSCIREISVPSSTGISRETVADSTRTLDAKSSAILVSRYCLYNFCLSASVVEKLPSTTLLISAFVRSYPMVEMLLEPSSIFALFSSEASTSKCMVSTTLYLIEPLSSRSCLTSLAILAFSQSISGTYVGRVTTTARIPRERSTIAVRLSINAFCLILNFFHHSPIRVSIFCTCSGMSNLS